MREGDTNRGRSPGKVTPIDPYRGNLEEDDPAHAPVEGSLDELLVHMHRVREAIPVNKQLREELKLRLAELQDGREVTGSQDFTGKAEKKRTVFHSNQDGRNNQSKYWLWIIPAVLLLAVVCWTWWSSMVPKTLEAGPTKEIRSFWLEDHPLEFVCKPQMQGIWVIRNGHLLFLNQYGNNTGSVKPSRGQSFTAPTLTRSGDKLALVRRYEHGGEEIISVQLPPVLPEDGAVETLEKALRAAEVIVKAGPGESLFDLAWSPDGKILAYSMSASGDVKKVYLLEESGKPVSLGPGECPVWSPDGSRLVVERTGDKGQPELWLTGPGNEKEIFLGEGSCPTWSSRGYLAFIKVNATERVLTYKPDGSPLFSIRQRQDEIRTLNLKDASKDRPALPGDSLLLAPGTGPGVDELNWLRNLELEGIREPRTLLLNRLNNFSNLKFSPDGKSLLVARRDGGTVSLLKVGLRERLVKSGEEL